MKLFLYISLLLFVVVIATPAKNRNQREIIENKEFDTFIRKLDTYPIGTDIRKMKDDPVIGKYLSGTEHLIRGYPKRLYNAYKKIYTNPKINSKYNFKIYVKPSNFFDDERAMKEYFRYCARFYLKDFKFQRDNYLLRPFIPKNTDGFHYSEYDSYSNKYNTPMTIRQYKNREQEAKNTNAKFHPRNILRAYILCENVAMKKNKLRGHTLLSYMARIVELNSQGLEMSEEELKNEWTAYLYKGYCFVFFDDSMAIEDLKQVDRWHFDH